MRRSSKTNRGEREKNKKKLLYYLIHSKTSEVVDNLGAKHNLPQLIQELTQVVLIRSKAMSKLRMLSKNK